MFHRRSPSSLVDDMPSAARPALAALTPLSQSHPNPLKSTLSDSGAYARNANRQSQSSYPAYFQQFNPQKRPLFTQVPIVHAGARLPAERRPKTARTQQPSGINRWGRSEAGISFRISKGFHRTKVTCPKAAADLRLTPPQRERTALSCNNPAYPSSLVARRLYGGNVASDVSDTGGCDFQPRRSA